MAVHALTATVNSTATISANTITAFNWLVTHRWRRTKNRQGHFLGREGETPAAGTALGAHPVTRTNDSRNLSAKQPVTSVIESQIQGVVAAHPEMEGELNLLLRELGVELSGSGTPQPPDSDEDEAKLEARTEAELERNGGLAWCEGDYAEARRDYARAVVIARAMANASAEARALRNLGTANDKLGMHDDARTCLRRAVDLYRGLGDTHGQADALAKLGAVLLGQGRHNDAEAILRRALNIFRADDDRFGEANVLMSLGTGIRQTGQLDDALAFQRAALGIHRDMANRDAQAACLNECAETQLEMHSVQSALTDYAKALAFADRLGATSEQARAHDGIAKVLSLKGDRLGAYTHWSRSWQLFNGLGLARADDVAARMRDLDGLPGH